MEELIKSIENGDHVIGVFLDFSKAFDTPWIIWFF